MKKIVLIILSVFCVVGYTNAKKQDTDYLAAARRLAVAEINRNADIFASPGDNVTWNYKLSFLNKAFLKLFNATGDSVCFLAAERVADYFVIPEGVKTYDQTEYNMLNLNGGDFFYDLYLLNRGREYLNSMYVLRSQFYRQPRTSDRIFCLSARDKGVVRIDEFMAFPFYSLYGAIFNEDVIFNDIAIQLEEIDKHTQDEKSRLNYYGWNEDKTQSWADKTTGLSPVIFSQGQALFMMSIVDVLDYFPLNHGQRITLIRIFNRLAASAVKYQDKKTGMWYQVTDKPRKGGNFRESSGTAMFVYSLAKGVNNGYLPEKYQKAAKKGFNGLLKNCVDSDGTVLMQSTSPADLKRTDASYNYYVNLPVVENDQLAIAAFILAAVELSK